MRDHDIAGIAIRSVEAADFDAIADITNVYVRRTSIHFGTQPVTGEELRADWETTRERYAFVVAVAAAAGPVGFAKAMRFRPRPAYDWTAEVGIYVDEPYQRRGLARALYRRLFSISKMQGFHSLVASIALPNEASVKLHEGIGFRPVGTFPEIGFKLGAFHDVAFWTLRINEAMPPPPLRSPSEAWSLTEP